MSRGAVGGQHLEGSWGRAVALFLSTFVNAIDRKGRVSVPAPFRAALGSQNAIVVFRSYKAAALEGRREGPEPVGRATRGRALASLFGAVETRQERTGRNPRTGTPVAVNAKNVPYFKPGKEMRERLND